MVLYAFNICLSPHSRHVKIIDVRRELAEIDTCTKFVFSQRIILQGGLSKRERLVLSGILFQ